MTTRPSRSPLAPLVWGVAVPVFLWTCLLAGLVFVLPHYKKVFADFGMRVSASTEAALAVADWVANYWYALLFALPFLFAPDVVVVLLLWRWGGCGLNRVWSGLMIALPIVVAILVALVICLPLAKLNEALKN